MRKIEIIGGGLSGLSLGLSLLRRGVAVRIIESGSYPRHKVCGEFVCGVSTGSRRGCHRVSLYRRW